MSLNFEHTSHADGRSRIWTTSRLRVWWLTSRGRYAVSLTRTQPVENLFGQLVYRRRWLLVRNEE